MWRLRVVHSTGYAYKSPVTASFNEARLTPRSDSRQNVILNRVETVPATRSYRYVDYWGTAVTAFDLHAPHTELEVTSSSVVETDRGASPKDHEVQVGWDDLRSEAVIDRFDEVLSGTHVHAGEQADPAGGRAHRASTTVRRRRSPRRPTGCTANWSTCRAPPACTRPGSTRMREGKGVCQDFAHLTLILLRGMGIPARYVSGYLHPKRKAEVGDTIDGQSHAWVQAWTGGWWNYDPTNDAEINEQYVSVGVGRDYSDVSPLKGIYSGEGSTDLDVVVEITRLGFMGRASAARYGLARPSVRKPGWTWGVSPWRCATAVSN